MIGFHDILLSGAGVQGKMEMVINAEFAKTDGL